MIVLKGVSEHNLKNISVNIPENALTVISGISGSGKSSLAFDTIFKEGQRRYLESFSAFAKQYLNKLERPAFEMVSNLPPAISINQKTVVKNPRSTVGTMSGIYDMLRLLYARLGECEDEAIDKNLSLFSFNSPQGACPVCKGLGLEEKIDLNKLVKDPNLSIRERTLNITTPNGYIMYSQVTLDVLNQVCEAEGFNIDIPWKELTDQQINVILNGSDKIRVTFGKHPIESRMKWSGITIKPRGVDYYKGILPVMEGILKNKRNSNILKYAKSVSCSACCGKRLNRDALKVKFHNKSIHELSEMTISKLHEFLRDIKLHDNQKPVARPIIGEIHKRTSLLIDLGLNYLTIHRNSTTLSGGEAQRIRLVNQVCSGLRGLLYVLDEPSIGLHQRDNEKLMSIIRRLVDNGNTVIVVEHDENTILNADWIIDIGPMAGDDGGEVLYCGALRDFVSASEIKDSKTHDNLILKREIPGDSAKPSDEINVINASKHNLKNIDVSFLSKAFNVITGVSGAGKSTLVDELIENTVLKKINGGELVDKMIHIEQSPIGRTPRSNPATYTKLFDHIRDLFGSLPQSKERKWTKSRFSFNNKGGRCEECQGAGYIQVGMHFLGDVNVICDTCNGKRFNDETLQINYGGKNINEVLEMSFLDAADFFSDESESIIEALSGGGVISENDEILSVFKRINSKIQKIVSVINELGLSYLRLGQSATTLSGGEAQRVKLSHELSKSSKGNTLYILDEPTTGLHSYDIKILIESLKRLVENGNTVITIEHDPDFIINADRIIDIGPESGDTGGEVVFTGTPNQIVDSKTSFTGKAVADYLKHDLHKITETTYTTDNTSPIVFKGVSTNNLKNVDIEIPLNKVTVVTGLSGSGKSSLVFDTIFSEGQNRFMESFPAYTRRYIKKSGKGEFESCHGLMPTIAISQDWAARNPRSTVGTISEIYDHLRLLYSRAGTSQHAKEFTASAFSFNHESGACYECKGLGSIKTTDPDNLISNADVSIYEGAMSGHKLGKFYGDPYGQYLAILKTVEEHLGMDFSKPWKDLPDNEKNIALFGTGDDEYDVEWSFKRKERTGKHEFKAKWIGFAAYIDDEYGRKHADKRADAIEPIMKNVVCQTCNGQRLNLDALSVMFAGLNISEMSSLTIDRMIEHLIEIESNPSKHRINEKQLSVFKAISIEIQKRLRPMIKLGLSYLSIDRNITTLSGGEFQRLRLATQINSGLTNVIYILDEPTIGLHSKDTEALIEVINDLKENKNTVVVVEHDMDFIRKADHIIDVGPESGTGGGDIVAIGGTEDIIAEPKSKTGYYLQNKLIVENKPVELRDGISIKKAHQNNLKNIDVDFPGGGLVCVAGVSGSGKSSLVIDVLAQSFKRKHAVGCDQIDGFNNFSNIVMVDQQSIAATRNSTPATYTGIFDKIQNLFANTDCAKNSNLKKSNFSYNSALSRCSNCNGLGEIKVSMDFIADVWVTCEICHGNRYKPEILQCRYADVTIVDVLNMTIDNAINLFSDELAIRSALETISRAGLGYLKLGQPMNTLSGGEKQRIKLVKELLGNKSNNTLYLFDEPTTGLHTSDVKNLLSVFFELIASGNSIIVIEHNNDVINHAHHVITLGSGAGEKGGRIIDKK